MPDSQLHGMFEHLTILRLIGAALFGLLTWAVLRLLGISAELLAHRYGRQRALIADILPIVRLLVGGSLIVIMVFFIISPPVSALFAVSAAIGLALGLGARDLVGNLIAGLVLRINRPFKVGDMVDSNGHYGKVLAFDLCAIRLQTFDDRVVTLPNTLLLGNVVVNRTGSGVNTLVTVDFHLPASVDADQVKLLAYEAAVSSPYVYLKQPVSVLVADEFRQAFLTTFRIRAHVIDHRLEQLMASDVTARLKHELRIRGISPTAADHPPSPSLPYYALPNRPR